jgi:hypothetical protein
MKYSNRAKRIAKEIKETKSLVNRLAGAGWVMDDGPASEKQIAAILDREMDKKKVLVDAKKLAELLTFTKGRPDVYYAIKELVDEVVS